MAKVIIKDGEISSSAGINIPGSLTVAGNLVVNGNYPSSGGGSGSTSPGGTDTNIQFNSGSTFSGSNNLVYNYTTNTLSGTIAQFTTITGTNIVADVYQAGIGSVGSPSYNFEGDNTGLYRPTANQVAVSTNGIEAVRFVNQTSGSQIQMSSLGGVAGAPTLTWNGDNNTGIFRDIADQIGFSTNALERLRITNTYISASVPITGTFSGSADGLYNLTASGISNFTNDVRAQFSAGTNITITNGTISSTGGGSGSPGGTDTNIQFNSGSTFSGSSNLVYNYTTNTLSGTVAQFTTLSASNTNVNGNITITGSDNGIVFPDGTKLITATNFACNVLVIAGGGGGGGANTTTTNAGGGGAGGYMESGVTTFGEIILSTGKAYRVTVGAGGPGGSAGAQGTNGGDSYFGLNYALGGGGGGGSAAGAGKAGGSGGGSATGVSIGTATSRIYQTGSNGGQGDNALAGDPGGGGGGAGGIGANATSILPRANGGSGLTSTITGNSVAYAGGGGGGVDSGPSGIGNSGSGNGGSASAGANGTANLGGGGGGAGYGAAAASGGAGGSGVIIIRYPANYTATFTVGVTQTTTVVSSSKVSTITAAGNNDTVTFS